MNISDSSLFDKKRVAKYDVARVFAILCVILCHATEAIYHFNQSGWGELSNHSRVLMLSFFTLGRLGVPLFLFLTGTLILKKTFNKDSDIIKFYKKNLVPLLIVNFSWVIIYNIYLELTINNYDINLFFLLKQFLFLEKVPLSNMWYIPMIVSVYIGLPFVAKIIKTFSEKTFFWLLLLIFIISFCLPTFNLLYDIFKFNQKLFSVIDIYFFGGIYGLYIVLGYFLDKKNKINKIKTIIILFLTFIITVFFQFISYNLNSCYNVWYNFPFLLICASCIYLLILNFNYSKINNKIINILSFISRSSLGMFFVHIIIQNFLSSYITLLNITKPLKVLLLFFVNSIICIFINFILSKNKFISKYVLLIK